MTAKEKKTIQAYLKAAYKNLNAVVEQEATQRAVRFPEGERFPTMSQELLKAQVGFDVLNSLARALDISNPWEDRDDYHWVHRTKQED